MLRERRDRKAAERELDGGGRERKTRLLPVPFQGGALRVRGDSGRVIEGTFKVLRPSGDDEFFRFLVENSPDGHFVLLTSGSFAFLNEAAHHMFGLDPNQSNELSLEDILHPSEHERTRRNVSLRWRGVLKGAATYLALRSDGSTFPIEVHTRTMDFNGREALHGVIRDITSRRKMEQRLEEMERNNVVSRLASGIAHDLNNLLAVIQSNAELALKEARNSPLAQQALRRINSAVQRGSSKVTHIRQMGAGWQGEASLEPLYINSLVEDVIDLTRARWQDEAEAKGVRYEINWDPGVVPSVDGSPTDMRAALVALMFNAFEAMPTGGAVDLSTQIVDSGEVLIIVRDTGEGIAEPSLSQLTDAFFTTRADRSMGLGLLLVQSTMARHGGRLEISSTAGMGSSFHLFLPAGSKQPLAEEPTPRPEVSARYQEVTVTERIRPKTRGGRSVLLIDDQPELVQVVETILESRGYSVDSVFNSRDGLAHAKSSKYSVVLTDLGMPDISGWEVSEQIHALQPKTPIVLMTGWAADIDRGSLADRHIDALLAKPFRGEQLLAVIEKVIRER